MSTSDLEQIKPVRNVKEAVQIATQYLLSLQSLNNILGSIKDLRLEEVEISEDRNFWLITLGYNIVDDDNTELEQMFPRSYRENQGREYKIFKIDAKTGQVQSMKIREL